jgi:hypothetical protein
LDVTFSRDEALLIINLVGKPQGLLGKACGCLEIFLGKNVYTVTHVRPSTRTKRSSRGQDVCHIQRPKTTGRTKSPTTSWTTNGQLRNACQVASNMSRLKSNAAMKPSHKSIRTANAKMLIIRSLIGNLLKSELLLK